MVNFTLIRSAWCICVDWFTFRFRYANWRQRSTRTFGNAYLLSKRRQSLHRIWILLLREVISITFSFVAYSAWVFLQFRIPVPRDSYLGLSVATSSGVDTDDETFYYAAGAPTGNHTGAVVFFKRSADPGDLYGHNHVKLYMIAAYHRMPCLDHDS